MLTAERSNDMYFSTSGSYRKTRMAIDLLNIILTIAIVAMFLVSLFWHEMSGKIYPGIFICGAAINILASIKNFINGNKFAWILLVIVAILLIILAILCWGIVVR